MPESHQQRFLRLHLWLIQFVGLIMPRRLRADWRQEGEAKLYHREQLLADGTSSIGAANSSVAAQLGRGLGCAVVTTLRMEG